MQKWFTGELRRRRHLFEFEDFGWFPALLRNTITDWLREAFRGAYAPAAPLVLRLLEAQGTDRIVDLCSGGSGPWEYLKDDVDRAREADGRSAVALTLTDLHPNVPAFRLAAERIGGKTDFRTTTVDARAVPDDLEGVRTIFTAFHHLRPEQARAVLADAAASGRAIGVFDFTRREWSAVRTAVQWVPVSMWGMIRHWRPRRPAQLFLTYVVPLTVLTSMWDALASQLRAYPPAELEALTEGLGGEDYRWETGRVGDRDGVLVTYLIGYPTRTD